jgi:hypothetical protein
MLRLRKKKKPKEASAAAAAAEKRAASKENVRVRHRGGEVDGGEGGGGGGGGGGGDGENEEGAMLDRRAMKAAAAGKCAPRKEQEQEGKATGGDDNDDDGDDDNASLRKGRCYGDAKETRDGFYLLEVRVENWAFLLDDVTVPVGAVLRFAVDKREKSMVEVTVVVKDASENVVAQSPALSAGQQWEYVTMDAGSFTFEDLEDPDLGGDIEVVTGDQQTKFAMHVAKKREKEKLQERENARRKTERDANKQFEAEFLEREAEKRAADADFVAATLEVEAVKMAAYKSDEATAAAGNSGASNLDENHQQAIEDSLKLYQETVAARRRKM